MHVAGFDSSDEEVVEEEGEEPLPLSWLPLSPVYSSAFLGVCSLPGKQRSLKSAGVFGADEERLIALRSVFHYLAEYLPSCRFKDVRRNLQKDIDELKSYGIQDVFVLCTKGELLKYRVPNLIDAYQECGICVHHYPIPDGDAPDITTCCTILEELRSCLESNRKTIIHCYGGLGRSCLIAACLLLQLSDVVTPQQAIDSLRDLRGSRAIQTIKQYNFIHDFRENVAAHLATQDTVQRSVSR
ncbi:cyclin-dependent kinase inhibitor 3 isoform X1 [Gallus gallus]|uniref:Cyclin-dependent kinase inhibitor 3 n=1 Tax=Gallus gallus TaxID=9031 RepID=A0A8V0Z256_CHICK|nr:cyclin-dependent kinase inhibitor 3 isoform X1 [Gallus gallus]